VAVWSTQVYLSGSECCRVLLADRLGVYNERHEAPVGYVFTETASVLYGNVEPQPGTVHQFDQLRFPYEFALAAAYDTSQSRCDSLSLSLGSAVLLCSLAVLDPSAGLRWVLLMLQHQARS